MLIFNERLSSGGEMEFHLAYLDPGTGSVIWQAVVGGMLGFMYLLRGSVSRIIVAGRSLLSGNKSAQADNSDSKL